MSCEVLSGRPLVKLIDEESAIEVILFRAANLDGGSLVPYPAEASRYLALNVLVVLSSKNDRVVELLSSRQIIELVDEKPAIEAALFRAADLDGVSLLPVL